MGRTTRSPRLQAPQDLANAQFLPQRSGHVDNPQRSSPLDVESLAGGTHLWRDIEAALTHTTDALGEAQQRFAIQSVGAAKVVDDVGGGAPLGRVPARLGELVVLHGGTVFVVAFGRAQIHAYTIGVLQSSGKRFFSIRVSMSGGRIGEAPLDFPYFSVLSWPMCALAPQTRAGRSLGMPPVAVAPLAVPARRRETFFLRGKPNLVNARLIVAWLTVIC